MLKKENHPLLRHTPKNFLVEKTEIKETGVLSNGNEYQVLMIELKEGIID